MKVQIVTDTGSGLTPELAAEHGISVVPLQVLIDNQSYRDGVDLSPTEFYERMAKARELPKTSQPSPVDLADAYTAAAEKGPVIGVHLSSALSGTWQTAVMAARTVHDSIKVFDSRTGSGGQAMMAIEAARMAAGGKEQAEILQRLEELRNESRTYVALNTLENAVKGGRVNPVAGMAASLLGIKPIVHVTTAGKVETYERLRGRARALDRLLEIAAESGRDLSTRMVAVAHGNCPGDAEAMARRVRDRLNPREVLIMPIGATIGTYAAEGAVLLSF